LLIHSQSVYFQIPVVYCVLSTVVENRRTLELCAEHVLLLSIQACSKRD